MFAQNIIKFIQQKLESNQLSHAYLVDEVQDQLSTNLADQIYGAFSSQVGLSDFHHISPEESQSIKVDQIRVVIDRLSRKPTGSMHLVVISCAHLMNLAAANALLKILEEPPVRAHFFLIVPHVQQLLPTIISRTQVLRCDKLSIEDFSHEPQYELLHQLYQDNPAQLYLGEDSRLLLKLHESVLRAEHPYLAIQNLTGYHLLELVKSALQIIFIRMRDGSSIYCQEYWDIYDDVLSLSRSYQQAYNINERAVLDRLGIALLSLKKLTS